MHRALSSFKHRQRGDVIYRLLKNVGEKGRGSDDPSSNPSEDYSFSVKIMFEKNENKQKEAGVRCRNRDNNYSLALIGNKKG